MKKQLLIGVFVFLGGFGGGILTYEVLAREYYQALVDTYWMKYKQEMEDKAYQAYKGESPTVAIWALKNLINDLNHRQESSWEDNNSIFLKLQLSHIRLALMYKQVDDNLKYHEHIQKAIILSNQKFYEMNTEESLMELVRKADSLRI